MALRLSDIKKTVRTRADGERYMHPKLLSGPAIAAQIDLALAYFNARLGRPRHEFEAEMLVRFFGDAKVARGLVACLTNTYRWRPREFVDVLAPRDLARLAARGLHNAADLRLFLYDRLNVEAAGFLHTPRDVSLLPLGRTLRLSPPKIDQLVALDASENAVLVRIGAVPSAQHVIASYNYHVVSALLRHGAWVEVACGGAAEQSVLRAAAAAQDIVTTTTSSGIRFESRADLFGSYARWGTRLQRALLHVASLQPDLLASGRVGIPLPGKQAIYLLERASIQALTGRTGIVRYGAALPELRDEWTRQRAPAGHGGWRLVTAPEPLLCAAGLAVAPFACRRGEVEILLWPVVTARQAEDARALLQAGVDLLPLQDTGRAGAPVPGLRAVPPLPEAIIAALHDGWGGPRVEPAAQALEGLLAEVQSRGFVSEAEVVTALGCATLDELGVQFKSLDPFCATYVAGLGLCSPSFADEMRKGLRRRQRPRPAA